MRARWPSERGEPFQGPLREWAERILKLEGFDPSSVTFRYEPKNTRVAGSAWGSARPLDGGSSFQLATILICQEIYDHNTVSVAQTVLHEVSHVMRGSNKEKHSIAFYTRLFRLCKLYGHEFGVTVENLYDRERYYKGRNATSVAAKLGVKAAQEALELRRIAKKSPLPCFWATAYSSEIELESTFGVDPRLHKSLTSIDGVPHRNQHQSGYSTYSCARFERCRNCGWEGYVYRPNLSYNVWDPESGRKWKDIRRDSLERAAASGR